MIYRRDKRMRFAHCDPAGIGFYPRYVELINEVVEDWFQDGLKVNFHDLHKVHQLGIPAVRLEVEYMIPSRLGDLLSFELRVLRIGNTSMTIELVALAEGRMRLRGELTVVLTDIVALKPRPIEGEWKARFERYLEPAGVTP